MNPFWCGHRCTTEPDEKGQGLCLQCGALLQLQLTLEVIDRFIQSQLKR